MCDLSTGPFYVRDRRAVLAMTLAGYTLAMTTRLFYGVAIQFPMEVCSSAKVSSSK
jgi:hypothetical protein